MSHVFMPRQIARRTVLGAAAAALAGLAGLPSHLGHAQTGARPALSPAEALHRLLDGNQRFAEGRPLSPEVIGSIEFGVATFGSPLVLVFVH